MFEKEIKFVSDFSLNKLKSLGSFFTYERILTTDIHPAINQYISAELDFLIFEDRKKLLQQSVFDYSGPQIAKYFNLISQEVKKNKRISYEDIKKLVIQAVSFNINFIMRPKWSIMKLVYDGTDSKAADEIKLILNSIYYYEYLKNVIINYIDKKKIHLLNSSEFEMLLNKLDKELFSTQAEQLIDNALYSMADFYNIGGLSKTKISPSAVEVFLKEKDLMDYLLRLRKALPPEAKHMYEIEEMRRILYTPIPVDKPISLPSNSKEQIVEEPELTEITVDEKVEEKNPGHEFFEFETEDSKIDDISIEKKEDEKDENTEIENNEEVLSQETDNNIDEDFIDVFEKEIEDTQDDKNEIESSDEDKVEPVPEEKDEIDIFYELQEELNNSDLFKEIDEDINIADTIENQNAEKIPEDIKKDEFNIVDDFNSSNTYSKKQIEDALSKSEPEKFKTNDEQIEKKIKPTHHKKFANDIFNYLTDKEIGKIVSSVFNEDREDFANTMERLMECISYDEATEILKSVFLTYRVNPYSKDAVALTNAVSNYFDQA